MHFIIYLHLHTAIASRKHETKRIQKSKYLEIFDAESVQTPEV